MKYSCFPEKLPHCFTSLSSITFLSPLLPSPNSIKAMEIDKKNKDMYWSNILSSPCHKPSTIPFPFIFRFLPPISLWALLVCSSKEGLVLLSYLNLQLYWWRHTDSEFSSYMTLNLWLWIFLIGVKLGSTDNKP